MVRTPSSCTIQASSPENIVQCRATLEFRLDEININGGNKASCSYSGVHLIKYDARVFKFDCQCNITTLFLFNYNMVLLGLIFPIYFYPVQVYPLGVTDDL